MSIVSDIDILSILVRVYLCLHYVFYLSVKVETHGLDMNDIAFTRLYLRDLI